MKLAPGSLLAIALELGLPIKDLSHRGHARWQMGKHDDSHVEDRGACKKSKNQHFIFSLKAQEPTRIEKTSFLHPETGDSKP